MINEYFLLLLFNIFKGNILYFEEISPEKTQKSTKKTIRLYLGEKLAGGSDIMHCQGK